MATELSDVVLLIEGQAFRVNKDVLCQHSDYFSAMFSGNFSEKEKQEISIDVVDANSMNIIIKYMRIGLIDLAEYSLSTIGELAISANFLQITELIKQIEHWLDINLSVANWVETMLIAENASYNKLEERAAAYGLYEFKSMKPEYISQVDKLVWYLSHSHLNTDSELRVFKFGVEWIALKETGADALLLILGCLDMNRLTKQDLTEMKDLIKDYVNSLAEKVVDCLHKLVTLYELSISVIKDKKNALCEMFTERVYKEVLSLVTDSKERVLKFQPCVALWKKGEGPNSKAMITNHLYKFNQDIGFTQWVEAADPYLWGWNLVAWGPTKIVVACGEHGRGTGSFWRNVKVYDSLRKEWIIHGIELPIRRHGGVAILDDELYIIGGVGGYRIVLDSVLVYDLKRRVFRKIAPLPDCIQSPSTCVHDQALYVSGHKNIYRYDATHDRWQIALETHIKPSCLVSYDGYIYCVQQYFVNFYRFRPGVDTTLETLPYTFFNPPATICNVGNRLLVFTRYSGPQGENNVSVEEYKSGDETTKVLWSKDDCAFSINDVCGSCAVIDTMPPLKNEFSPYLKRTLANYEACYPN